MGVSSRMPMRGIFAGCCARAPSGHVAAALPSKAINSRRLTPTPLLTDGRAASKLRQNARRAHLAKGERAARRASQPAAAMPAPEWIVPQIAQPVLGLDLNRSESAVSQDLSGSFRGAPKARARNP